MPGMAGTARKTVADLLANARSVIQRMDPEAAWDACGSGAALIVDIRSIDERRRDGGPGLFAPSAHGARVARRPGVGSNRHAVETERRLILLCAHGCSSSLAAATLVDLGYRDAGDVEGGFEAWLASGLPTACAPEHPTGVRPGMAPPD